MHRHRLIAFTALSLAGCVVVASQHEDPGGEPVASVPEAHEFHAPGSDPLLDPGCEAAGDHDVHNREFPAHEHASSCAVGQGFTFDDAVDVCGGPVKYFSYSCSDFPPSAPYQPDHQRAWTAYYACCLSSSVGGPRPGHGGPLGDGPRGDGLPPGDGSPRRLGHH